MNLNRIFESVLREATYRKKITPETKEVEIKYCYEGWGDRYDYKFTRVGENQFICSEDDELFTDQEIQKVLIDLSNDDQYTITIDGIELEKPKFRHRWQDNIPIECEGSYEPYKQALDRGLSQKQAAIEAQKWQIAKWEKDGSKVDPRYNWVPK